jgi:aminoglycoside phosphotransferase (APT) family kinase protein
VIAPGQPLDLDRLREVVSREIPWVAEPDRLQVLGFGFRSVAVETATNGVVLIGKVAETAAGYARIFRMAPRLSGQLPVSIPQPTWCLPVSEWLPGGALGYPKLPGRTLETANIEGPARQQIVVALAGFLRAFHRVPIELAWTFDVPTVGEAAWTWTVESVLPALRRSLTPAEYIVIDD